MATYNTWMQFEKAGFWLNEVYAVLPRRKMHYPPEILPAGAYLRSRLYFALSDAEWLELTTALSQEEAP